MTLPTDTNTDPALRARIAAILAPFPGPVADTLASVAARFAAEYRARGLPYAYGQRIVTIGAWNDVARLLDRAMDTDEATALEACIRAHLEAGAEPVAACPMTMRCIAGLPLCQWCAAASKPIPEPPTHPSPAEMVRAESLEGRPGASRFAAGIEAERARLRAYLFDLAEERLEAAKVPNDPAPRDMSAAIEAAEFVGESRALRELAEGLK